MRSLPRLLATASLLMLIIPAVAHATKQPAGDIGSAAPEPPVLLLLLGGLLPLLWRAWRRTR